MHQDPIDKLTHWDRVMHMHQLTTTIGSDNSLAHGRRQTIIWTKARILLIGPLGKNFSEISIKIHALAWCMHKFSVKMIPVIFIRPSLDRTYYGMALSVRPSAEIKFSKDVRLLARKTIEGPVQFFFKFAVQMCLGVPSINLWLIRSYLI